MITNVSVMKVRVQLIVIIFFYLILIVPLMNKAFWHDEIYNTSLYLNSFPVIQPKFHEFNWSADWQRQISLHPPVLSLLYYVWIRCFGDSEISLHIPVAIAGLLGIILLYFLGNIILDNDVSFIATLATTFSSSHIMYSVQTVHAIFEMLSFLASTLCLAHFVITKSPRLFRWLLIFNVFGICIAYYYVFYLIAQTVIFWIRRKDLKIRLVYFIMVVIFIILFLGFIKFSYDRKKYSYDCWPKNDFRRAIANILYLPAEFAE